MYPVRRLLPKHCAPIIAQVVNKKKREKTPKKVEFEKPGAESYRQPLLYIQNYLFKKSTYVTCTVLYFFGIKV